MTDRDALLAAILAAPADDAPRLVYADWLDEHAGPCLNCDGGWYTPAGLPIQGNTDRKCGSCGGTGRNGFAERAAYIRWGVAHPENSAVCLCLGGRRQPQPCETCQVMGSQVVGIPRRADGETHYVVNRGFVCEVRLPTADFLEHTAVIFQRHPVLRVVLTDAVIHPSGGNDTYYVGGLGVFPSEYWRRLEGFRSRTAAHGGLSQICVEYGRKLGGLPSLRECDGVK